MPKMVRIAVAQTIPVSQELDAPANQLATRGPFYVIDQNLLNTIAQVQEAAKQNADILVFPEFWLQDLVDQGRQHLTYPYTHMVSFLQNVARQFKVAITGTIGCGVPVKVQCPMPTQSPFVHLLDGAPCQGLTAAQLAWAEWITQHPVSPQHNVGYPDYPQIHNTSFFIDDEGKVLGEYTKRNLWHSERDFIHPGFQPNNVFETKFGKIGTMICWDISHPSAAQELSDQDVDIVLVSAYWMATDCLPQLDNWSHIKDYEKTLLHSWMFSRAVETESVWALCNIGGDPQHGYMGGSGVWAPLRGNVGGVHGSEACLCVLEIDMNVVKDAREVCKIRNDHAQYMKIVNGRTSI